MIYSKHTVAQQSKKSFTTDWQFSEGVFETPQGKFIARIKKRTKGNTLVHHTISQHNTREGAQQAYDRYYQEK